MKNIWAFRRGDVLIAGIILSLAAAMLLSGGAFGSATPRFAQIKTENHIQTIDLSASNREMNVENHGFHLIIETENGRIRVKSSDCPDQICVRTGWLSRPGAAAACVPARVSIELTGETETDALLQ